MLDIIYGINVVEMALKHTKVRKIFADLREDHPVIIEAQRKGISIFPLDDFKDDSKLPVNRQKIIALIEPFQYVEMNKIIENDPQLILFLDQITDPHNLGAIIRSASAFGIKNIILPKDNSAIINATVHKTSAGCTFLVNIARITSVQNIIKDLKKKEYWFVGLDQNGKQSIEEIDKQMKIVLVLGSEGKGIRAGILKEMDFTSHIKINNMVESLNVSVSAGIALYELTKK